MKNQPTLKLHIRYIPDKFNETNVKDNQTLTLYYSFY